MLFPLSVQIWYLLEYDLGYKLLFRIEIFLELTNKKKYKRNQII